MIAHNLCPTTCFLLKDAERLGLKEGDYEITPIGACFVKPHIRKGLLPMELERVMAAREVSKKAVKTAKAAGQMDMVEV